MVRDHSFPQHPEFWAEPRNLPVAAEFLCFREILRNSVLASNKGTNTAHFGRFQVAILYVYVILPWNRLHDCWLGRNGKNVETIDLSLSEIFQVYLLDICICQLQLAATSTAYSVEFRGHRKLITICGKFAAVSRGIWQTGPRNLKKFAAENCGP